jgi:hypothetical protein
MHSARANGSRARAEQSDGRSLPSLLRARREFHGWSAFGGADHGWQDVGLERRAWRAIFWCLVYAARHAVPLNGFLRLLNDGALANLQPSHDRGTQSAYRFALVNAGVRRVAAGRQPWKRSSAVSGRTASTAPARAHNSEPLNNLERRLPAPGGKARGRRGLGPVTLLLKRDSASRPSGDCRNFLLDSCR